MKSRLVLTAMVAGGVLVAMCLVPGTRGSGAAAQDVRPRPRGPVDPASCGMCHADVIDRAVRHGPVAVHACATCHEVESAEQHTFRVARTGTELCTYCHDMNLHEPVVHRPLLDDGCLGCHDPHGGADNRFLRAPTVDELCTSCHADVTGGARHVHGPVAAGACSACHLPHTSAQPALLPMPKADLCLSCHAEVRSELDTMRVVHGPVWTDCGACHDAHASNYPLMLHAETEVLCLGCHEGIRHTVETAATQHAAVTTDRQCLNCHDPHASDYPRVLLKDMKLLCYECHDREIELPDGRMLQDIKKVIESGTSLHGPVAQDNCAACHMIHGGDNFRLLVREYPPEFYAPFAEERYALCFSCHDMQLVQVARTTALTDFRNGDTNLHYLHVNREKKGRTCRACHETHASRKEKHIRESVPFGRGGWELPIGFEKTATGGSCAPGCHAPYAYDRVDPIPYPEAQGQTLWPEPD